MPYTLMDPCAVLLSSGSNAPWDRRKGIHRNTKVKTIGTPVTPVYLTISDDDLDDAKVLQEVVLKSLLFQAEILQVEAGKNLLLYHLGTTNPASPELCA
uniref:Unnamed protein n=1 Tax=Alcelaphine gammaherpesvirus 1 TaxID=35252 RepID=Q89864_9GAMA|nr:unnamed [Alcelaphine gammaherpesvirus 1]CAA56421.1 unnamed [Alcelaphine gammaherpesvirus 1]